MCSQKLHQKVCGCLNQSGVICSAEALSLLLQEIFNFLCLNGVNDFSLLNTTVVSIVKISHLNPKILIGSTGDSGILIILYMI